MTEIIRNLSLVLLLTLFFLVQSSGILSFFGVRANLLLVLLMFAVASRIPAASIFLASASAVALFFFSSAFWFPQSVVLFLAVLFTMVLEKFLTGRFLIDFLALTAIGTVFLFFGIPVANHILSSGFDFSEFFFPPMRMLLAELGLNLFFAALGAWGAGRRPLSFIFR